MRAKLGDVIKPAKVIRRGTSQCPVLSMTMHDGIMLQSDRFKKSLASVDQSDYKVVNYGQLVVGFPIDEGVLYIQRVVPRGIMSPAYNVWDVNYNIIDPLYLELSLHSPQAMQYYKENLRGTTARRRSIPTDTLLALPLPLPSLDEQRQIAAVLDKVSDLMAKRHRQLNKLDELIKSRFMEMFGNFVYERDRWNVCTIGDVADTIDPQPSHRTPPISLDGIPYVGIAECNYSTRRIDFEKARKVGQNVLREHTERYTLDEGDFIIGKIGTIGKPFFIPIEQTYTLSANTVLIKPIKGKVVSQYLYAVFQSEYMDRIIDAEKKSTSQPAFGIQKVRRIEIPMPPLELQQQFAAFVAQTDKSKSTIQKSLEKLEILKKALLQKYFG